MITDEEIARLVELVKNYHSINNPSNLHYDRTDVARNVCFLISTYAGLLYFPVNTRLRKTLDPKPDFVILFEYLLNKALREFPIYGNELVYRMDDPGIEFDILKNWYEKKIGCIISFPNFLSTSKDKWDKKGIVFKITTSFRGGARDISRISEKVFEKEVLFMSRSKFRILYINEIEEYIELEEVERDYPKILKMDGGIYINDNEIEKLMGPYDDNEPLSLSDLGLI